MASMENTTIWRQIQAGVRETERLIGRKEYNMAMIKARQTLEYMVRCSAEKACLVEGDLSDTIDQLYEGRWIDKTTKDHYHTIRILGNKAVHEGDDTAYDANQAYQLLAQEVLAFSGEGTVSRTTQRPRARQSQGRTSSRNTARSQGARRPQSSGRSAGSQPRRTGGKKKRSSVSPAYAVLRFLVPVLAVVVILIVVIRFIAPGGGDEPAATTAAQTETTQAEIETQAPEPTEPETQAPEEAGIYVVTGDGVRIREEPSTDGRVLAQLSQGTELEFVRRYNSDWTVVNYEGQEAYVSSDYVTPKDQTEQAQPEEETQEETE